MAVSLSNNTNEIKIYRYVYVFFFLCKVWVDGMTASSVRCMSPPHFGRLQFPGTCFSAWCSKTRSYDKYPSLTVTLGASYYILFVATQGSDNEQNKHFASSYLLHYRLDDDDSWELYKEKGVKKVHTRNE